MLDLPLCTTGERIVVRTPPAFEHFNYYWRTITQQQYVVFRVRACSDCHIALSPTPYVDPSETYYDFVISGWTNTQTQIRLVVGKIMKWYVENSIDG